MASIEKEIDRKLPLNYVVCSIHGESIAAASLV